MRRVSVFVAFGLVLAGAVLASQPTRTHFPLPPRGGVSAEWLPDGTPVFVIHDADGAVSVVEAVHAMSVLDAAVAWCPAGGRFIGVFSGSRFDQHGYWMGGPSPGGLMRFAATKSSGLVRVGPRVGALPRDTDRRVSISARGDQDCWQQGPPGDVALDAVVLHGEPFSEATTTEALRRTAAIGTFLVRGILLERPDGSVQLCSRLVADQVRCADDGLVRPARGHAHDSWYAIAGYQRVRVARGLAHRIVLVAVTAYGGWVEAEPVDGPP
jgi:hypothetical protein